MKEWALKHPVLTFLLVSSAIDGAVKVFRLVTGALGKNNEETEEEKANEPAGDIQ